MKRTQTIWGMAVLSGLGLVNCTIEDLSDSAAAGGSAGDQTSAGSHATAGATTEGNQGGSSHETRPLVGGDAGSEAGGSSPVAGSAGAPQAGATSQGGSAGDSGLVGQAGAGGSDDPVCSENLQTDSLNCGTCGHSCLGGECHVGQCSAVVLAKDQFHPQGLAVDGEYIYWANFPAAAIVGQGQIQRVALTGGKPVLLASNLPNPGNLVLDQTNIYFSNVVCCSSTIAKLLKTGGSPTSLATGQAGPQSAILFDGMLYWPNHVQNGAVMSVPVAGGVTTPVYASLDRPQWVAADATNIYWAELEAGNIRKAPRAGGGQATPLATGEKNPVLLTLTAQYLFWANDDNMMRLTLSGGAGSAFQASEGRPGSITTDGKNVFWIGSKGIKQAPAAGGTAQTLVTPEEMGGVGGLILDGKSVIWTDATKGRVMRKAL